MTSSATPAAPGFERRPGYPMAFRPADKHVRVEFAGTVVADAVRPMVMLEDGHGPVYYFQRADVRMDLMHRTTHSTHWPHKGDASYWSLRVGDAFADNVAWSYERPPEPVAGIRDLIAFYGDRMDAWHESELASR